MRLVDRVGGLRCFVAVADFHYRLVQVGEELDDLDMGEMKKKKKSKAKEGAEEDGEATSSRATAGSFAAPTDLGPNDIYPYAQILQRIYDALSEKNPELMGGKKFTMIPPQVWQARNTCDVDGLSTDHFFWSGGKRRLKEDRVCQLQGRVQEDAPHDRACHVVFQRRACRRLLS